MIVNCLMALISWVVIFPTLFGLGSLFRSFVRTEDVVLRGVVFFSIGLAVLSFLVLFLDTTHWLSSRGVWGLLLVCLLMRWRSVFELRLWIQALAKEYARPPKGFSTLISLIGAAALFALTLGTLSPEIGGDALCYQLYNPKVFLAHKSLAPFDFDLTSYFPLLLNNLYLIGLATGGVFAAKLFHLFCGVLIFFLIERVFFIETQNKSLSLFTGLAFLLTPGIYNQLSTTYIDVGLALYTTLSVIILKLAFDTNHRKTFYLAGFFLGCAVSIKYMAMISGVALAGVWGFRFLKEKRRLGLVSHFFAWCFGVFLSGHVWLLRNWVTTDNPFYPFFGEFFGRANRPPADYFDMGYGKDFFSFFFVFWNMFVDPNAFGAFPNRIGVVYLLILPFILFAIWKNRKVHEYAIFFFISFLIWFLLVQNDRWLYPILPAMLLIGGFGLCAFDQQLRESLRPKVRKMGAVLGVCILGIYLLGGLYHYRYAYRLYWGQPIASYLTEMQRVYPISKWINENLPKDAKILMDGEPSKFYIDPETVYEGLIQWQLKYDESGWDVNAYNQFIRSLNITHVLIGDSVDLPFERLDRLLHRWLRTQNVVLLKKTVSENIRDTKFWYRVYEVKKI